MISTVNKAARAFKFLLFAALLAAGCARLKQCAYEGFSRDQWQQPDKVVAALNLKPGNTVADLGSGGGYFTFRLAQAVAPNGKVYAVDVDRDMIALVAERARKEAPAIVETIVAKPNDPALPGTVDLVFTSNTYHHIDDRVAYFTNLRKYLRPGGRVAIIDFDRRAWIEGLLRHYTPSEFIQREMEQAGYVLQKNNDFLDRQSFLIFAVK
jgi:ubiquinone/menaquinone biosynthesis C-methylase UbiE